MNKVVVLASFAVGATIGSAATWYYMKKRYSQLAEEAIEEIKEEFRKEIKNLKESRGVVANKNVKESSNNDINDDANCEKTNYSQYSDNVKKESDDDYEEEEEEMIDDLPYVIPPDEFGLYQDYEQISLTYYADGVLTDENDIEVENPDELVGDDFADHFGEYEDDSVFVRNDKTRCEYEILADPMTYEEAVNRRYANVLGKYKDNN